MGLLNPTDKWVRDRVGRRVRRLSLDRLHVSVTE